MKLLITIFLPAIISLGTADAQNIDSMLAGFRYDQQKADTLYSLAMKQFHKARFDSADYLLKKGTVFAEKTGNAELIATYIIQQSNIHLFWGQFEEGLAILKKSNAYLVKTNSSELHEKYLRLCGRFYENLLRNDSALYYYHQCEVLNNRENPYGNWIVYYNMAQLFKRSEAFSEAEEYFTKAYSLTKPKAIRRDHITVLVEFADLYYRLAKPEKFAPLLSEQQQLMSEVKRDFSKSPVHSMFFTNWKKEPLEKKVRFMKNVKQELDKSHHIGKAALANNYIAGFYEEENKPDTALNYIRENQRVFEKQGDILNLYSNTTVAYKLLKKAGRALEATAEADRLFALKDSLIKLQQREITLDLETKYQAEKKDKDIALLNSENQLSALKLAKEKELLGKERDLKEVVIRENLLKDSIVLREKENGKLLSNENDLRKSQLANEQALKAAISRENVLKEAELAKEKKIRWQLTAGALLLVVSGATIFVMYRKQKSKNRTIQKQSDDLQVLMREIHHRVKNNLQVISSLLDLQSLSIKNKQASGAVKEGKIRVQSMALIHQNLYNEGNIKGIIMEDYIKSLIENLFNSYNITPDKIRLVTDIDHLNLDVDTVIPLGLIINELLSNSLKYAFKEKEQGQIYVGLKENNKNLELKIKDNGCGFPTGWNSHQNNSFGYGLVNAFAQKLKAKLDIYNDGGACISMNISRYKLA